MRIEMFSEIAEAISSWRLVHLVGLNSLRARYARSRLGQSWLTIANGIFIIAIGLVWSKIWKMESDEYLPYVGVGHVIYVFLAQCINESTGTLIGDARIYMNDRRPFMISTFAHLYRHFLIFLHNIPILVGLILWSSQAATQWTWHIIPAAIFSLLFVVFVCYALSLICARYRDLGQVVNVVMQISFLLTPVMWQMKSLPDAYHDVFYLANPMAAMLEALRNPLLGLLVPNISYVSIAVWAVMAFLFACITHHFYGRKIIFWLQ